MAVEVVRGHKTGGSEVLETFSSGTSITVDNGGHLVVKKPSQGAGSSGKSIATFAPGQWAFARVVEETR